MDEYFLPKVVTVRLLSLDSFKFRVMGKLLQDAAADMVTICTLRVHPGSRTDHVTLSGEYILHSTSFRMQRSYHGPKQILAREKGI